MLILIAGIKAARETIDLLLGAPPTPEYIKELSDFIKQYSTVVGIHDIMVHDYGVGRKFISFHAEVPSDSDINLAHEVIDTLEKDMSDHFGAIITIHYDPIAVNDDDVSKMRTFTEGCVKEVDNNFMIHDFRMTKGEVYTNLIFDLVIPVDCKFDDEEAARLVESRIREKNPHCFAVIKPEHPYF